MTGFFIFIMAASGILLAFERQVTDFVDRDLRAISDTNPSERRLIADLLETARRSGIGDATAIVVRNSSHASMQLSIRRGRIIYVDPYSGAILGPSSAAAHGFFSEVERLHRALGAPLGSKGVGHWLAAVSNLLFGALILLGLVLWLPRRWSWQSVRAAIAFRRGLHGRTRDWNWHNVIGIWCALPLLVIVFTGVVMSFGWANALLFRLTGSTPSAVGREVGDRRPHTDDKSVFGREPDYDRMLNVAKTTNPDWRTITLNVARSASAPLSVTVDTGTGGQPQKRTQYLFNRDTARVMKITSFADGSLGQRLRAFVRFGHTGEYGGFPGQVIAAIASLGACLLVYTGLALAIRRLRNRLRQSRPPVSTYRKGHQQQLVASVVQKL